MKKISMGMISDTINGINVNSSIPCNSGNYQNCGSRTVGYVVMHYTGNLKDSAQANVNYFKSSGRNASAHFFVDDTAIFQNVELRDKAWHCGGKSYKHRECRNANSFGIEMCCTAGNHKISEITKKNAAYLCAHLCKLLGISASDVDTYVVRHYDVTGKMCPAQMAGSGNNEWSTFKTLVKNILSDTNGMVLNESDVSKIAESTNPVVIKVGSVVTIKNGAIYGGLSATRGKSVPLVQCGGKRHTVTKIETHNGVEEALLKEIVSWVSVSSLNQK